MARIQEPPRHFAELALVTQDVAPSDLLRLAWEEPRTHLLFGRDARFRFDAPSREFGVLYAAFDLPTAFAETVLRDAPQSLPGGVVVPLDFAAIQARRVVTFRAGLVPRALRLIKLYDEGLAAAHTDNQIAVRDHYPTTQRWGAAFHAHPLAADGIVYMSRYMGARRSVALFERCREAIDVDTVTPLLEHAGFAELALRFNLAIDRP